MTSAPGQPVRERLDAGAIIELYEQALNATGRIRWWQLDGFDRTGIPVVSSLWTGRNGRYAFGVGYGSSWPAATIGALGEAAEEAMLEHALADPVQGSYTELVRRHGPDGVADPLTLSLPAGSPYTPDMMLHWVPAVRVRTGERVLVPVEWAADEPSGLPAAVTEPLITPITNGLGAGDTSARALGHGLLELLQRDGDTVSFRALDQGVVIDVEGTDHAEARFALDRLRSAGIEPVVKLAADEFVPVVYVAGRDDHPDAPVLAASAMGEGAHPDTPTAVGKALLEYASSRARKAMAFGPLADVERLLPDYLAADAELPVGDQEPHALAAMQEWLGLPPQQLQDYLAPVLLGERSRLPLTDLPTASPDLADPEMLLADLLGRLADFDVLAVSAGVEGITAAKVIVPGLEVETMSYQRIGERVARRLLDRGSPLVGHGEPDRPNRLPVRLTAAATERLGGPVWLDRVEVDRVLGTMYPLYREPRRHAVQRLADEVQ